MECGRCPREQVKPRFCKERAKTGLMAVLAVGFSPWREGRPDLSAPDDPQNASWNIVLKEWAVSPLSGFQTS
jgi:hypothetical protein